MYPLFKKQNQNLFFEHTKRKQTTKPTDLRKGNREDAYARREGHHQTILKTKTMKEPEALTTGHQDWTLTANAFFCCCSCCSFV